MVDLQPISNQNLFPTSYLSFSHIVGGCTNSYYIREAQVGGWKNYFFNQKVLARFLTFNNANFTKKSVLQLFLNT